MAGASVRRGLDLEVPPWYHAALADTALTFGAGIAYASADTQAVIFPLVLTPIRSAQPFHSW